MLNILVGSSCRQQYEIGVIITYICARPQATQGARFGMVKHFHCSFWRNKCEESIRSRSISDIILQTEREREGDWNSPSNHSSKRQKHFTANPCQLYGVYYLQYSVFSR